MNNYKYSKNKSSESQSVVIRWIKGFYKLSWQLEMTTD